MPTSRFKWLPMDYIVFILTVTWCSVLLIMVCYPLYTGIIPSEDREILIKHNMTAVGVIFTTWFGAKIQGQREKSD